MHTACRVGETPAAAAGFAALWPLGPKLRVETNVAKLRSRSFTNLEH